MLLALNLSLNVDKLVVGLYKNRPLTLSIAYCASLPAKLGKPEPALIHLGHSALLPLVPAVSPIGVTSTLLVSSYMSVRIVKSWELLPK